MMRTPEPWQLFVSPPPHRPDQSRVDLRKFFDHRVDGRPARLYLHVEFVAWAKANFLKHTTCLPQPWHEAYSLGSLHHNLLGIPQNQSRAAAGEQPIPAGYSTKGRAQVLAGRGPFNAHGKPLRAALEFCEAGAVEVPFQNLPQSLVLSSQQNAVHAPCPGWSWNPIGLV